MWPHLAFLLRSFKEESVDDSDGVRLDVLISPRIDSKADDSPNACDPAALWLNGDPRTPEDEG